MKWANALLVKQELEKQLLSVLGPKDERDNLKHVRSERGFKRIWFVFIEKNKIPDFWASN